MILENLVSLENLVILEKLVLLEKLAPSHRTERHEAREPRVTKREQTIRVFAGIECCRHIVFASATILFSFPW